MQSSTDTTARPVSHVRPVPRRRGIAGVTLIELMIVVVVIAILGVIAVPSYRQYTIRAQRTEAKSALLQLQTNQEKWYLQNNTYTDDPESLGFDSDLTENGVYTLAIAAADGGLTQGYVATATPTAGGGSNGVNMSDDDDCTAFTLTSQGERSATPDPQGRCW